MGTVKQDANGVPEEWTLLHAGANRLVKNGKDYELHLSVEDLDAIAAYQAKKGEAIPIDSNHYLHILAEKHGVEESEALRLIPSGVAAMGFGTLFREGNDLKIRAEWTPGAYELLKEKIFRYCSPVIRGLKEGPVRITSVAMENEPALNCEDVLAAGGEGENVDPEDVARSAVEMKRLQDPIERALGRLLGKTLWNEIVLSGEDDAEDAFERTADAIEAKADAIAAMRKGLGMADDAPDEAMSAALDAMKERAVQADTLRQELDALVCAAEEKRKAELIEQGLQEGKLTHALEDWAKAQDCAALASYLEHAPVAVPGRMTFAPDKRRTPDRSLTPTDEAMIRKFGFDKDEYQRAMLG
jgi:phage I-like protein